MPSPYRSLRSFAVVSGTLLCGCFVVGASLPACGGAATQDVLDTKSSSGGTSGSSGTSGTSSGTSGATSGGTSGTSGASGGTVDASDGSSGNCPSETEPNDSRDEANTLVTTMCGAIQPNSESDFLTFQLADKTTSMQLTFTGQVTLRVEVNNQTVTLGNGDSPKVPFVKGHQYVIEIKALARANKVPWQVNLLQQ